MKKFIATILALVLLCMLALPAAAVTLEAPALSPQNAAFAAEVLRLTNVERARHNLPALSGANSELHAAAQRRAVEINTRWDHTRPNGTPWHTIFNEFNVGNRTLGGENLGRGQSTPAAVVDGWMRSDGHRANILGQFTHLGVGVFQNSAGTLHWTQLFINDGSLPTGSSGGFNFWRVLLSIISLLIRLLTFGAITITF